VRRTQSPADVMRPDVGGEPVMAVIRHANREARGQRSPRAPGANR
jgi:hypothetical protein